MYVFYPPSDPGSTERRRSVAPVFHACGVRSTERTRRRGRGIHAATWAADSDRIEADAGQRGSGVAIVRSPEQLREYLTKSKFPAILQEYVPGEE